jgi:hypothetical protein
MSKPRLVLHRRDWIRSWLLGLAGLRSSRVAAAVDPLSWESVMAREWKRPRGIVKENADAYLSRAVPSNYESQNDMRAAGRGIPWQALAHLMTRNPRISQLREVQHCHLVASGARPSCRISRIIQSRSNWKMPLRSPHR